MHRPQPSGMPEPTFVDETTIIIQWAHNMGERDEYEVSYSPNGTSFTPQTPQYVNENRFRLTGLDPYTTIQFDVRTVVNSVTSTPTTWRQRTFAASTLTHFTSQGCQFSGKSLNSGPDGLFLGHSFGFLCTK